MDKLQTMMEMQKQFQEKVGFNFDEMSENEKSDYIKEMMLWTIDEMVDSFHFFMNVLIASGMDADELFQRYLDKNKINIERQNTGY